MATYTVTFERIGRNREVPPLTVVADDVDNIADAIWHYANGRLGSKWFDVSVNLETGRVSIEAGRFGSGTIVEAVPA